MAAKLAIKIGLCKTVAKESNKYCKKVTRGQKGGGATGRGKGLGMVEHTRLELVTS